MKKYFVIGLSIVTGLLMIVWLIMSAHCPKSFWSATFQEWINIVITLFIGFWVAYVLTERNTKSRLLKEQVVYLINKLYVMLNEQCKATISESTPQNWNQKLLSQSRTINNTITLLLKYQKQINAVEELQFVKEQFIEYKTITTTNVDAFKKDGSAKEMAITKIDLILGKLDEIELKQFR